MGKRIDSYPSVPQGYQVLSTDYVLIDSNADGTRKIPATNLGGGGGQTGGITADVIAPEYDGTGGTSYNPGEAIMYHDKFYVALTDTAGTFDPNSWEEHNVVWYVNEKDSTLRVELSPIMDNWTSVTTQLNTITFDISPEHNSSAQYNSGSLVLHDNQLYRCTNDNTIGNWASTHNYFVVTTIADELASIKQTLSTLASEVEELDSEMDDVQSRLSDAESDLDVLNARKQILGDDYNPNDSYYENDIVIYDNTYYICTASGPVTGAFDPTYWNETDVPSQIQAAKAMGGGSHNHSGTSVPDALLGDNNDIYMQYDSNGMTDVYGKINGGWVLFPTNGGGGGGHVIQPLSITERTISTSTFSVTEIPVT